MKYKNLLMDIRTFLMVLVASFGMFGCADDEMVVDSYGHVQFRLYKEASYKVEEASRSVDRLQYLSDAKKITVHFQDDASGFTVSQSLVLEAYNSENAEFGLSSDKLKLLVGRYSVIGYELFDGNDNKLMSVSPADPVEFEVVSGGLTVRPLSVKTVKRGMATFKLVKNIVESRALGAYTFNEIKAVDLVMMDTFTQEETKIMKVPVKVVTDFVDAPEGDDRFEAGSKIETAFAVCDTLVWLKAGTYTITEFTTYSDKRAKHILEKARKVAENQFTIEDNKLSKDVNVPITFAETDDRIKDYFALREIWLALDGPNWSYEGDTHQRGTNWNFDKDLDLWGEQPGVSLDKDGRVSVLVLDGMKAKGEVPAAIGQLAKLRSLSLGSHSEKFGGEVAPRNGEEITEAYIQNQREEYKKLAFETDYRTWLSKDWQSTINMDPNEKPILKNNRPTLKTVQMGVRSNGITGISIALMNCKELMQLFVANGLVSGDMFVDNVTEDAPFDLYRKKRFWKWENLTKLTDVEFFNNQELKSLPMQMLAKLPSLTLLNVAANRGISGETLLENWKTFINGKSGGKLQILYLTFNRLKTIPETSYLKKMEHLGMLDCSNNEIEEVHCFGKGVTLGQVNFSNNKIKKFPKMPAGSDLKDDEYFFGYTNEMEILSFANNELEEFPDMFNTRSVFTMGMIDFSNNKISRFENADQFRGINASQLNLSGNRLTEFPTLLFTSNSPLRYIVLSGNQLTDIPKGTFSKGDKLAYLEALDLSFNKIKKLPSDFNVENLPYLSGVELSFNSFDHFPWQPLNIFRMERLFVRNQRDSEGNRCLTEWPKGIGEHPSLRYLFLGSNDLRKIDDKISPTIFVLDIKDNPNISIDMSNVCPYIERGMYKLSYDKTQDIRGCEALGIK